MIGKIYTFTTPYYDSTLKKQALKSRPVLVVGKADASDYSVLPISRVTNKINLDLNYDIEINPAKYPKLNLKEISYVRTHKQTTVNTASLVNYVGNIASEYSDLYLQILKKLEEYNKILIDNALQV